MNKYWEDFNNYDDVWRNFGMNDGDWRNPTKSPDFPDEHQILFAVYSPGDYSGSAFVLFKKDGQLYEVNGDHCSCYGLEGQWTPEETSWEALEIRNSFTYDMSGETLAALRELIASRFERGLA